MIPTTFQHVRLIPRGSRFDILTFWSMNKIDLATKTLFGINEQTDDLELPTALKVAAVFDKAFAKVHLERSERHRRKVSFPVQ